eukprot:4462774-Pyramimonas_sp.AAC.1
MANAGQHLPRLDDKGMCKNDGSLTKGFLGTSPSKSRAGIEMREVLKGIVGSSKCAFSMYWVQKGPKAWFDDEHTNYGKSEMSSMGGSLTYTHVREKVLTPKIIKDSILRYSTGTIPSV